MKAHSTVERTAWLTKSIMTAAITPWRAPTNEGFSKFTGTRGYKWRKKDESEWIWMERCLCFFAFFLGAKNLRTPMFLGPRCIKVLLMFWYIQEANQLAIRRLCREVLLRSGNTWNVWACSGFHHSQQSFSISFNTVWRHIHHFYIYIHDHTWSIPGPPTGVGFGNHYLLKKPQVKPPGLWV